jgi:hypothetical protein
VTVVEFLKLFNLKFGFFYCILSQRLLSVAKCAHYNKSIHRIVTEHVLNLFVNILESTTQSVIRRSVNHQHIVQCFELLKSICDHCVGFLISYYSICVTVARSINNVNAVVLSLQSALDYPFVGNMVDNRIFGLTNRLAF